MRLFLALELTDRARQHLGKIANDWKRPWPNSWPRVAWVREENLHVTLKFLGEVAEPDVPRLCETLQTLRPMAPLRLYADRPEWFPSRGRPRIVAAAMGGDVEPLKQLYGFIEEACERYGFPRERREYRAHVTFGRSRDVLPLSATTKLAETSAGQWPGPVFEVRECVLMQSHLRPQGPEHVALARFPLSKNAGSNF